VDSISFAYLYTSRGNGAVVGTAATDEATTATLAAGVGAITTEDATTTAADDATTTGHTQEDELPVELLVEQTHCGAATLDDATGATTTEDATGATAEGCMDDAGATTTVEDCIDAAMTLVCADTTADVEKRKVSNNMAVNEVAVVVNDFVNDVVSVVVMCVVG
jgi:hypothetical protein